VTTVPHSRTVFAELLFPLAFAADLNMGLSIEHTLRTVWVSMQLADHLRLSHDDKVALYYGGLLKDSG
jgi:response regulator RpfG family c-di-GMP phosphodiesterase